MTNQQIVGIIKPVPTLRPYQVAAVDECARALMRKSDAPMTRKRKVCLVAPTGAGKTLLAAEIIRRALAAGKRILFLAHRRELLNQCYDKLLEFGVPEHELSMLRADDKRFKKNARVVVASVQTLRARMVLPPADLVFLDEAHTCGNATNVNILSHYPSAFVVGLTATPIRGRRGLRGHFDELVIVARPSELIKAGYILQAEIFTVPEDMLPDTARVKTVTSETGEVDFDKKALAEACEKWDIVGAVATHYLRHGENKPAVCFAASIKSSQMIVEALRAKGVPAAHIDGTMGDEERNEGFRQLREGEIKVLSNVGLLCEGWDAPYVKCLIMARPTLSLVIFLQQVGRVVRPYGTETATILDHAGNVQRHGFPDADIEWSLDSMPRERVSVKRCPVCWSANKSTATVCVNPKGDCGPPPHEWTREDNEQVEREITIAEGRLARAQRPTSVGDARMDAWNSACREAIADIKKEKWARIEWKKRFDEWPDPAVYVFPVRPQASWPDARRRKKWDQLCAAAKVQGRDSNWAEDKYETLFSEPVAALHEREGVALGAARRALNTQGDLKI